MSAIYKNGVWYLPGSIGTTSWRAVETLYSGTYGILYGRINTTLNLATIVWSGNSSEPSSDILQIDLPSEYVPVGLSYTTTMRNGDSMEINRNTGKATVRLETTNWSAASITYPIK